jgi:aspartate/tyrosine/aromatic aminotransferase
MDYPSVAQAEKHFMTEPGVDREHVPINGKPGIDGQCRGLDFSKEDIDSGRLASAQALPGTGSLQNQKFLLAWVLKVKKIHIWDLTWGTHPTMYKRAGISNV